MAGVTRGVRGGRLRRALFLGCAASLAASSYGAIGAPSDAPKVRGQANWQQSAWVTEPPPCGSGGCGSSYTFGPTTLNGLLSVGAATYRMTASMRAATGRGDAIGFDFHPMSINGVLTRNPYGTVRHFTGSCQMWNAITAYSGGPTVFGWQEYPFHCTIRVDGGPATVIGIGLAGDCRTMRELVTGNCKPRPQAGQPAFPPTSAGVRRRRRTRSRAATSTTTGGTGSTRRARSAPSRAVTPATPGTAGPTTSRSWPSSGSRRTASRWSGAASSRPRGSGRTLRSRTTGASVQSCSSEASSRSSRSITSRRRGGSPLMAAGPSRGRQIGSPGSASALPASWRRFSDVRARSTSRTSSPRWVTRWGCFRPATPTRANTNARTRRSSPRTERPSRRSARSLLAYRLA